MILVAISLPREEQFLGLQDLLGLILESCFLSHLVIKTFHEDSLSCKKVVFGLEDNGMIASET